MTYFEGYAEQNVLVVGDLMIDKFISGTVDRISPEAPVPVLKQTDIKYKMGGAGNVIANITNLGGRVRVLGRVGNDQAGDLIYRMLCDQGVDTHYLFREGQTIVKTRVSASNQQFIRIDEEIVEEPSAKVFKQISSDLDAVFKGISIVVLSDYAKGFLTPEISNAIISEANRRSIKTIVDPKGKSAKKYYGATIITPNNKEFMDLTGLNSIPDESSIKTVALHLCKENDFSHLIFTRSEKGISLISADSLTKYDFPAVVQEVVDVTGAGDTVVSVLALSIGAGYSINQSIEMANAAASVVISKFGTAQATQAEIYKAMSPGKGLLSEKQLTPEILTNLRKQGKQIVFTNGCFDLVHAGHISSFLQAKSLGDVLIVGVNSDASIRRIKGESRPIVSLQNRILLLSALQCVDYVIPFEEDTPVRLIEIIKPDVLVKGKDWEGKIVAGAEFVKSYGGTVKFIDLEEGLSTTSIIEKIRKSIQ